MSVDTIIGDVSEAGKRGIDTRDVFVAKQEAYQDDIANNFVSQVNAVGEEINTTASEINVKSANVDAKNANVNTQAQNAANSEANAEASAQRAEAAVPVGDGYNQTTIDAKNDTQNKANFNGYGFVERVKIEDILQETSTPNTLEFKRDIDVRVGDTIGTIANGTQITYPLVPFDPIGNDEILDDKINGLICQLTHNKGDIVVVGTELVTGSESWIPTNGTVNVVNGVITISQTIQDQAYAGATFENLEIGQEYMVYVNGSGDAPTWNVEGGYVSVAGGRTHKFIATEVTYSIILRNFTAENDTSSVFSDLSIKLNNQIRQAIVNSPSDDLATNDWQSIDECTTQDVAWLRKNKTTKSLVIESFRGVSHFGELYSQNDIMMGYGKSLIEKNLYEDNDYEYVFLNLNNTLNAGGKNSVHNNHGRRLLDASVQNGVDTSATSTYECFSGALTGGTIISGISGDASGTFYDKKYLEGENAPIPTGELPYTGKEHDGLLGAEASSLLSSRGLDKNIITEQFSQTTAGNVTTLEVAEGTIYEDSKFVLLWDKTASTLIGRFTISSISINTINMNETIIGKLANEYIIVGAKTDSNLTNINSNVNSIIANPDSLKTDWLSRLSSGKKLNVILDFVDDHGNSNIPDGIKTTFKINGKADEIYQILKSTDNGVTWNTLTLTTDYIFDIINNSITFVSAPLSTDNILYSFKKDNQPLSKSNPNEVLQESLKVISSDSNDINKANLLMSVANNDVVQVGASALNQFTITKKEDEVFSYTDEGTNVNPTVIPFLGKMADGELCVGVYGSNDNVIDTSEKYIKRLGVWDEK